MFLQPDSTIHDFNVLAFVIVCRVLDDLEEIIKRVVSGLIFFIIHSISSGSTLDIKKEWVFPNRYSASPLTAIFDPRSEPPAPMLTKVSNYLFVQPVIFFSCTSQTKLLIFFSSFLISFSISIFSNFNFDFPLSATCSAARSSV